MSEAEHTKVVELLTGLERFVRLVVERRTTATANNVTSQPPQRAGSSQTLPHSSTSNLFSQPSLNSLSREDVTGGAAKSPKVFGLPKPYTGLYSASSYMANRPSYMRTRYCKRFFFKLALKLG